MSTAERVLGGTEIEVTPKARRRLTLDNKRKIVQEADRCKTGRVPVLVEKRNGAFFRLVQLTTNVPPGRAATGGTRHGQGYQGRCARA